MCFWGGLETAPAPTPTRSSLHLLADIQNVFLGSSFIRLEVVLKCNQHCSWEPRYNPSHNHQSGVPLGTGPGRGEGRRGGEKAESNNSKNSYFSCSFVFNLQCVQVNISNSTSNYLCSASYTIYIPQIEKHKTLMGFCSKPPTPLAINVSLWQFYICCRWHYPKFGNCLSTICVTQKGIIMLGCHVGICSDGRNGHLGA